MKKSICLSLFKLLALKNNVKHKVVLVTLILLFSIGYKTVFAQESTRINISGLVTDEMNEPLIGVNIVVNGTSNGTVTDVNGRYNLSVNSNDTLLVTYIGFTIQEIAVNGRTEINIVMEADVTGLDEVVIVGYGEVKRANLLGSVETMAAKDIEDIPATSLTSLFEGRMAGVLVAPSQPSGMPGNPNRVVIRLGEKTFGATTSGGPKEEQPLYIVDGFEVTQQEFDVLDPSEIESISVLKDASAAVYGTRGSNGVVLIKTKRGKEGKLRVSYSGSYGISDATQQVEMLSAADQARIMNIVAEGDPPLGWTPITEEEIGRMEALDYNWLDEAWKLSSISRHTINISGGNEKVTYFVGGSKVYETGNFNNLDVNKYSYRIGMDAEIIEGLKASVTASFDNMGRKYPYYKADYQYQEGGTTMAGLFADLLMAPKWKPSYIDGYPVSSALASFNSNSYIQNFHKGNTVGIALNYEIPWVKGLSASLSYNRRESHSYTKQYIVPYETYVFDKLLNDEGVAYKYLLGNNIREVVVKNEGTASRISENYGFNQNYQFNGSLSYSKKINRHSISGFINYEQYESYGYGFDATAYELVLANIETQRGFENINNSQTDGDRHEAGRLAGIGRLNYSYADKYLLETAFRYEGKTEFAPKERMGLFPSVAVGWVMSEENFFKGSLPFVDFLKIRYSWGRLGYASLDPFEYKRTYTRSTSSYLFGNGYFGSIMDYVGSDVVSSGVSWEKADVNNLGMDIKMFNSRIDISVNAFYNYQYDILESVSSSLPKTTGLEEMPSQNHGRMESWGYDMSIGYNGKVGNDFKWHINGIFQFATNRVLEKTVDAQYANPADFRNPIGKSTYSSEGNPEQGYVTDGIIRTREQLDAINAEWNARWGHDYMPFGYTIDPDGPLGLLYFQDVGRPGVGDEPFYVQEPDGNIDSFDEVYIEKVNDSFVAKNLLPTSSLMGFTWKNLKFDMLWTFAWGVGSKMIDKAALSVPDPGADDLLNAPSFWSDYYSEDNINAKYPNPYWSELNKKKSSFWMRDVYQVKLHTVNLSYTFPKKISERWGIPSMRLYFIGKNLWSPVSTFDYKDDAIARYTTYPLLRTFSFGVNISL